MTNEIINYLKRNNGSGHIVEHVGWHESGDYLLRQLFSTTDKPYRQHKYDVEQQYVVIDKAEVDALERQTCGRKAVDYNPMSKQFPEVDFWQILPNGDPVCSYCGSLKPERVLELVKEHGVGIISPAKSYKWYVTQPNVRNAMEGGIKYYRFHDTDEFLTELQTLVAAHQSNTEAAKGEE